MTDLRVPIFGYRNSPDFEGRGRLSFEERSNGAIKSLKNYFSQIGFVPESFIDVGCSYGEYVNAAESLGIKAIGIEIDSYKVEYAEARGLKIIRADLTHDRLGLPKAEFILLRHVIEHIFDFLNFMDGVISLLQPEGILWVEVPNQGSIVNKIKAHQENFLNDERFRGALYPPTHINGFEKNTMRYLGKKLNLKLDKIITYSYYDPKWFLDKIPLTWKGRMLTFLSTIGMGENMAIIYKKSSVSQSVDK